MDQPAANKASAGPRARRSRARAEAFARHGGEQIRSRYETPAWLERSFVLPVQDTAVSASASDEVRADQDRRRREAEAPRMYKTMGLVPPKQWPEFVRPPSEEIDFVAVVRRDDACRAARRTALVATTLMVTALLLLVLTTSPLALPLLAISAVGTCASVLVLLNLRRAPLPVVRG
jgi:hypothetical protein